MPSERSPSSGESPVIARTLSTPSIAAASIAPFIAMRLRSRQVRCGRTGIPVSRCSFAASAIGSALPLASGESVNVSASTPAAMNLCAQSQKNDKSVFTGGLSSIAISFPE